MNEENLTQEQRADLVAYYFERAHESVDEAKYLRDGGYFNGAVTRLYYACFSELFSLAPHHRTERVSDALDSLSGCQVQIKSGPAILPAHL